MEQAKTSKQWTLKNAIMLAVFSVIMLVLTMIVVVVMNIVATPVGAYYTAPGVAALICAPFYMAMADKIAKRGVLFFTCLIPALIFALMGQFYSAVIYFIFGVIGELCMLGNDSYHNPIRNLFGFFLYMVGYAGGGIFPMIFFRQQYLAWYTAYSNGDTAAVQVMIDVFGSPVGIAVCLIITAVGCVIGGLIGRSILNRHVRKARI